MACKDCEAARLFSATGICRTCGNNRGAIDALNAENATLRDQLAAAKESLRAMVENARRLQDQRDEARALLTPLRALVERMYTDAGAAIERLDRAGLES